MKAMTLRQYGDPDVLTLEDLPIPEPGEGEVRIKVNAVSINPVDYKRRRNWAANQNFPVVLGWDVAGIVDQLGAGVTDFKVGGAVYGMICFPAEGRAYAEYVTAPVSDIALKPAALSFAEAAAMTLAPLTAQQAFDTMGLRAGQTLLIHAAAGGVGHYAVQLARVRGAHVIASGSAKNRDFILGLGADEFIDYTAAPFEEQVSGVDAVFDTVGGETQTRSFGVVKPGGWLVTIVGSLPDGLAEQHGIHAAQILVHPSRAELDYFSVLVAAGTLRSHVSQTFPLEQVAEAHRAQETGRTVGKLVLEVNP
jgi:NADPH:quinone reductase-like Zn-dependent oxidoreductase